MTPSKAVLMQAVEMDRFESFADECVRFMEEMGGRLREEVDPIEEAERSSCIITAITKKWTLPTIYLRTILLMGISH